MSVLLVLVVNLVYLSVHLFDASPLPAFAPEEHVAFLEGDIIAHHKAPTKVRNLISNPNYLWPNKTLVYEFSNEYHDLEKLWIKLAIKSLENRTCVRFMPRTNQENYMYLRNAMGCASPVGYNAVGPVQMFLSLPECIKWGTIQHEFLHALGFWHEHTRPDRDRYVEVQWDNIIKGMEVNFMTRSDTEAHTEGLPYDFDSVMHYRATAFSRGKERPTLVPLRDGLIIGQREKFSQLDLAKLNRLYDCGPEYYQGNEVFAEITISQATGYSTTSLPSTGTTSTVRLTTGTPNTVPLTTTGTSSTFPLNTGTSNTVPLTTRTPNTVPPNTNTVTPLKIKETINSFARENEFMKANNLMIKKLFRRRRQNYFPYNEHRVEMRPHPVYWPPHPHPVDCPCYKNEEADREFSIRRRCEERGRRPGERGRPPNSDHKFRSRAGMQLDLHEEHGDNFEHSDVSNSTTTSREIYDDYDIAENNATQYAAGNNKSMAIKRKNM